MFIQTQLIRGDLDPQWVASIALAASQQVCAMGCGCVRKEPQQNQLLHPPWVSQRLSAGQGRDFCPEEPEVFEIQRTGSKGKSFSLFT